MSELKAKMHKIAALPPDLLAVLKDAQRVVSKFHYTDPTRPDPRTAWVSDKSADFFWS